MDIMNTVAIVTGGSSGLGAATSALLAARGAKVAILDVAEAGAEQARRTELLFVQADVTDDDAVAAALARVAE